MWLIYAALLFACSAYLDASPAATPLREGNSTAACEAPSSPSATLGGSVLSVMSGTISQMPNTWSLPPCIGWDMRRVTSVAVVVGAFTEGDLVSVLRKLGAISSYPGTRYWSVTDGHMETLITDAFAVVPAQFDKKRPDFLPTEFKTGNDLVFSEQDNRLPNPTLYRMRVVQRSQNQIVIDISNINVVKRLLLTLFEPEDLHTALFISSSSDGSLTCYAVSELHTSGLSRILGNPRSHLNRLLALYAHITGIDVTTLPWAK
jgi:hypothetical protein